jgi:hypothetical protein
MSLLTLDADAIHIALVSDLLESYLSNPSNQDDLNRAALQDIHLARLQDRVQLDFHALEEPHATRRLNGMNECEIEAARRNESTACFDPANHRLVYILDYADSGGGTSMYVFCEFCEQTNTNAIYLCWTTYGSYESRTTRVKSFAHAFDAIWPHFVEWSNVLKRVEAMYPALWAHVVADANGTLPPGRPGIRDANTYPSALARALVRLRSAERERHERTSSALLDMSNPLPEALAALVCRYDDDQPPIVPGDAGWEFARVLAR